MPAPVLLMLLDGVGGKHQTDKRLLGGRCLSVARPPTAVPVIRSRQQQDTARYGGGLVSDVFQSPVAVRSVRLVAGNR